MVSAASQSIIDRSQKLYDEQLKQSLEANHLDRFVSIEPDSGDYFLADTLDQAVQNARQEHPNKISYTIKIGHLAPIHIGVVQQ